MKKNGFFICSSDFAKGKIPLLGSGLPLCSSLRSKKKSSY